MAIPIIAHYLLASAPIVSIVTKDGIYPITVPQLAKPPFIIMNIVAGSDGKKIDGANQYWVSRVQLECCAVSGTQSYNLGEKVKLALLDIIKGTALTFKDIDITFADTDMTDFDDERTITRRVLHYRVRWRNA